MLSHFSKRYVDIAAAVVAIFSGRAASFSPMSVASTLAIKSELSTLGSLFVKASLSDALKGIGAFTVFEPSSTLSATRGPASTFSPEILALFISAGVSMHKSRHDKLSYAK
jgi:hypothetical protein